MTNPNETGLSTDPKSLKNEYKAVRKEFLDGFGKFYWYVFILNFIIKLS